MPDQRPETGEGGGGILDERGDMGKGLTWERKNGYINILLIYEERERLMSCRSAIRSADRVVRTSQIQTDVLVEVHFGGNPLAGLCELRVEAHDIHGIERVDDC